MKEQTLYCLLKYSKELREKFINIEARRGAANGKFY